MDVTMACGECGGTEDVLSWLGYGDEPDHALCANCIERMEAEDRAEAERDFDAWRDNERQWRMDAAAALPADADDLPY